MRRAFVLAAVLLAGLLPEAAYCQEYDEESSLNVNGYVSLQAGTFVPLLSNMFQPYDNEAFVKTSTDLWTDEPCDPVMTPNKPCYPTSHGQDPGSLSMFRATLQLEGDWKPHEDVNLHAVFRAARSLETDADEWAQMPTPSTSTSPAQRRREARQFVLRNYYQEFDLREFYVDAYPTDWLSFRIGRQQVTWGDTGQYQLLDVINPANTTWHFGPLESFEDTRIPLWILKTLIEFTDIDHSLELVWVPGLDRPEDLVTTPLTFVGAWGLPYSNTPSPFIVDEKVFLYPRNSIDDTMRFGFRWKGSLSNSMTYTLVYYYTHQLSPPIPLYYDLIRLPSGFLDSNHMEKLYLGFPRTHVAGFSLDWSLESPIGAVVRLEAAVEPNHMFPQTSTTYRKHQDPNREERYYFDNPRRTTINYALVIMRPTMIRFLNPAQNFLFVFQFMHSMVPGMTKEDRELLVQVPGFNEFKLRQWDSMKFIFAVLTQYLNGLLTPKLVAAYIYPNSGFISAQLGVRLGDHWRLNLALNDFFGADAYKGVGLFRDRDEVNLKILYQF